MISESASLSAAWVVYGFCRSGSSPAYSVEHPEVRNAITQRWRAPGCTPPREYGSGGVALAQASSTSPHAGERSIWSGQGALRRLPLYGSAERCGPWSTLCPAAVWVGSRLRAAPGQNLCHRQNRGRRLANVESGPVTRGVQRFQVPALTRSSQPSSCADFSAPEHEPTSARLPRWPLRRLVAGAGFT